MDPPARHRGGGLRKGIRLLPEAETAQGKAEHVPLAANRFLTMMSETTLGWLLLEQAIIALEKLPGAGPTDKAFYEGKRYAAQYFANNVLPNVLNHAAIINNEDASALEIPADALGAV